MLHQFFTHQPRIQHSSDVIVVCPYVFRSRWGVDTDRWCCYDSSRVGAHVVSRPPQHFARFDLEGLNKEDRPHVSVL